MILLHLAPVLISLGIFLATVFDLRVKAAFRVVRAILFDPAIGGFALVLLAGLWSLLVVAALHMLENRSTAAWLPQVLS